MNELREEMLRCYDLADSGSTYALGKRDTLRTLAQQVDNLKDLLPKFDELDERDAI